VDVVALALASRHVGTWVASVCSRLADQPVRVCLVTEAAAPSRTPRAMERLGDAALVDLLADPHGGLEGGVKRATDIVRSALALVALFPLLALLAASVRLESPGPVLFRQERFGLGGHHIRVLKFWLKKGASELLAALASERVARLGWHATLAGDGDCGPYRSKAEAHGLSERVAFPGWLDKPAVGRLLAQADILVLPSHLEGLPMAVIEALANAVPAICTLVGALPDYLVDGRSALFVEPGDAGSLAMALERLIGASLRRASIIARGAATRQSRPRAQTLGAVVLDRRAEAGSQ